MNKYDVPDLVSVVVVPSAQRGWDASVRLNLQVRSFQVSFVCCFIIDGLFYPSAVSLLNW